MASSFTSLFNKKQCITWSVDLLRGDRPLKFIIVKKLANSKKFIIKFRNKEDILLKLMFT